MPVNLSALAPITTAATALSNLILVSPQDVVGYQPDAPAGSEGASQQPPAFLFHYEGEQTVGLESDITDHFIEDNTAVQDQIALKPEIITTHGFIGELNDIPPKALAIVKTIADKLTAIVAYTPVVTETAQLAYSEALLLYQVAQNAVNAAISTWSSITGEGNGQAVIGSSGIALSEAPQNKQQVAFQQFYGWWRNRTLFTVQTPWAVFQNMAIKSLRAIQDAETNVISDFELSFKMIRVAQTIAVSNGNQISFGGQLNSQAAPTTNLGTSAPVSSISLGQGLAQQGVA